jgi:signal transduction histidine kinase/CheY-like chemotaxis protein
LLQRLRHGERVAHFESERLNRDGKRLPLSLSLSPVRDEHGSIVGSALIARDIGERKRAEQALRKRLRQLDVLSRAGQALILGDQDAPPLQNELFDHVRMAISCEIYLSYLVNEDGTTLQLVADHGLTEEQCEAWRVVTLEDSICGLVVRRRTPIIIEQLQGSDLAEARRMREAGARCYAGFPLIARGVVRGVASFASTTRGAFRDGDLQVIQTVCDQVAAMMERASLLEDLHRSELSLKLSDRRKDDLIATLAHELRNPLAPIRNAIGILRRSELNDPRLAWCRDVIDRQVLQMTHLLEDLLDVSRITRNKVELRRERVELSRAVDQAIETTRPLIESLGHQLSVALPDEPVHVYGDLTRLTQVFANLLNNAAKYTPSGGRIDVLVERDGERVRIVVRDSGVGLEGEQLAKVFDMFAQFAPALERSRGGLGIGLALARGLIELHGGRILAFSAGPGRGSEFVVHLPVMLSPQEEAATADAARAEVEAAPGHRILVVDDNTDAAQTLSAMLSMQGQEVRAAYGGLEGLRIAEEWRPDAAVVDIGMPELNGYEVCRRIRAQPWGERMLLIACTGWGQYEDRQRARAAGFDFHLVKPIEADAVSRLLAGGEDSGPGA